MAIANTQTAKIAEDTVAAGKEVFETAKIAAEKTAAAGQDNFRKAVDTSVSNFGEFTAQSKQTIEAMADSAAIATEVAQTLSAQAAAYTKKAMEDQVAHAKRLAGARTFQEAMDIQSGFAKSAMDQYMAEANRWNDAVTAAATRTWKPINDRMSAVVSQINAR